MSKTELGNYIVARPANNDEIDLLLGNELQPVMVLDLDGYRVAEIKHDQPWTHSRLESVLLNLEGLEFGFNVYLGKDWIGGSEI